MNRILFASVLFACTVPVSAQTALSAPAANAGRPVSDLAVPAKKGAVNKSVPIKKGPASVIPAPSAAPAAEKTISVPAKTVPPAEDQEEESVVMIDSRADADYARSQTYAAGQEEPPSVTGGIPSSYGQCTGVISEAGRSVLVFESLDDGAISFVQVAVGKSNVSWKLVDRIPRSAD